MYYNINNILHRGDCIKCKNSVNNSRRYKSYESLQSAVKDNVNIRKVCRCCHREYNIELDYYKSNLELDNIIKAVKDRMEKYDFTCDVNINDDIVISTHIERWIVSIDAINTNSTISCTLYHKNNLNYAKSEKCRSLKYPEYHVQYKRVVSVDEVLKYISEHERSKWGYASNRKTVTAPTKNKVLSTI